MFLMRATITPASGPKMNVASNVGTSLKSNVKNTVVRKVLET